MKTVILIIFTLVVCNASAQKGKYPSRYTGAPIITDSASTLFIPTLYNENVFSSDKMAVWGNYYANFLVYDFSNDSYRKLFNDDTYIETMPLKIARDHGESYRDHLMKLPDSFEGMILMVVKKNDTNKNGRIEKTDASILYACNSRGEELRSISPHYENVTGIRLFGKLGFAMVEFQKDDDKDLSFRPEVRDFYYRKLDLKTLKLGEVISVN